MTETGHIAKRETSFYATGSDFCRIFKDDMNSLYLLSLVLTADPAKAEQCFVSGLDDCSVGNQVFKDWARSWARRAVIKNAIRSIAPAPVYANDVPNSTVSNSAKDGAQNKDKDSARPQVQLQLSAVFDLQPFERFVYVMSVLEGYSDRECALLLGCTRESLLDARVGAVRQIGRPVEAHGNIRPAEPSRENRTSIFELKIPSRLATSA